MEMLSDFSVLDAAGRALLTILDPGRLLFLATGAVLGLIFGIVPGIGGVSGIALLLPFTYVMDPFTAFAFLLGLAATTATGDPIPAILFGVPGGAGSAATVLDGYPMAKRGEAGRALSAAYMSSLLGGLFGAMLMGITIPLMRPIILFIGSPELLALSVFGLSMVAVLSGNAPLRGIAAGCIGIMLSLVGPEPASGQYRWTYDLIYLWDGLPLMPLILGIFALPELCDLAISRTMIASSNGASAKGGMWQGAKDVFRHWFLVMRCSGLGAFFGSMPGIGGAVIDWLAYGHALKSERGASRTFGTGDVRGVIASESANNAKEGGALVPTIAFGVPGSAGMAVLLGAFLMQGLTPGPDMLTVNIDLTYSMVWSIAIANIVGAGLCYAFSPQLAKIATLRYSLIVPGVLCLVLLGAYAGLRSWGDLVSLFLFGILGWTMKLVRWPRPPLVLGFVLGAIIERNLSISVARYDLAWLSRPVVILLFATTILILVRWLVRDLRISGGMRARLASYRKLHFRARHLFYVLAIAVIAHHVRLAMDWDYSASMVPLVVGAVAIIAISFSLLDDCRAKPQQPAAEGASSEIESHLIYMDLAAADDVTERQRLVRGATFFGWLLALMGSMAVIGLLPTVPLFVAAYMRAETRERWTVVASHAAFIAVFIYVVFGYFMNLPWPPTYLGAWLPAAKIIPSV